nr:MAG TPA: hypothetical protein [Caudoviricetes sp.]
MERNYSNSVRSYKRRPIQPGRGYLIQSLYCRVKTYRITSAVLLPLLSMSNQFGSRKMTNLQYLYTYHQYRAARTHR